MCFIILKAVHTRRLCRARLVVCDLSHRVDAKVVRKSVVRAGKVVHDLEKCRPMLYFETTNSIPGTETTNLTSVLGYHGY